MNTLLTPVPERISSGSPIDYKEMRYRRLLIVVVGYEMYLRQTGTQETVDLVPVQGQRK